MPTGYRVELASSNRAGCKNRECLDAKEKIPKGELRYGSWVDIGEHGSWSWKHWGCVTPVQIAKLIDYIDGDLDMIDGYDEIPSELQEKVARAVEQGHVDDADWRGDVEMNRPGATSFRVKAKKTKKTKDFDPDDSDEDDEESSSPKKSKAAPKRGRPKKETVKEDEQGAPKQRGRPKKAAKEETVEDSVPAQRGRPKKAVKEEALEAAEEKPAPKKRGRPAKAAAEDAVEQPAPKKANTKAKRGKKADESADSDEETQLAAKKAKAAGRKRKSAVKEAVKDDSDIEAGPDAATVDASAATQPDQESGEEDFEEPVKPQRGRKKAAAPAATKGEAKAKKTRGKAGNTE
ncbi:MAG: hypothetical protein M1819_004778 [Sarea resinae]|nr:MAG: hypothetical protein M1819_004778 [Sarea resinae]